MKIHTRNVVKLVLAMALMFGVRLLGGEAATAVAVATLTAGFVTGITVTSGGIGYESETKVTVSGGGGSGAVGKAILSGDKVGLIVVLSAGSGYTTAPPVVVEAPPKPLGLKLELVPKLTVDGPAGYVLIEPRTFEMGSPTSEDGRDDDEVQHSVRLSRGYWMSDHETTQAEYESVMGSNPSEFKGLTLPVEQVSWNEAVSYCEKLTLRELAAGRIVAGQAYRLPTEAEWEYAARGGTTGAYAGELISMGWYDQNPGDKTHSVKGKRANGWGLYDMHGNVWEWCSDWSGVYPSGSVTDPTGATSGSDRVFRGGCWNSEARNCRSANRGRREPGFRNFDLGFRSVLSSSR